MGGAHFLLWLVLAGNPELDKATKLVADLQYSEARAALDAAIKRSGNDRETLLRILELQGIVYATLNDATKAGKSFQTLMVLDPDHKLTGDFPPRVMTPFYEARGRASELGKLDVKALPAAIGNKRVGQLAIEISTDPLKMAKKVKFHVKADNAAWAELPGDLAGKVASVAVDGARVEWWADVIGEREAVIAQVGSDEKPRVDLGTAPAAVSDKPVASKIEKKKLEPNEPPPPPREEERERVEKHGGGGISGMRIGGIVIAVLGAGAIGTGAVFGVMAQGQVNQINNAGKNAQMQVIEITQAKAYEIAAQEKSNAIIANTLFGIGGGLAALGVILFIVAPSDSGASAMLMPAGSGLVLSGTF
jgi:hypothetical protein